jgi:hypothetical protein
VPLPGLVMPSATFVTAKQPGFQGVAVLDATMTYSRHVLAYFVIHTFCIAPLLH